MYGKHFASMYTGSMYGAGINVFAVWGYAIGNTDKDGMVEINPVPLSDALGNCTPEDIEAAIQYLTDADPRSRSKKEDGRRLVEEGQFLYRVVNHGEYKKIRMAEDRREYLKLKKRQARSDGKSFEQIQAEYEVEKKSTESTVSTCVSTNTDTDTDTDTKTTDLCDSDQQNLLNSEPNPPPDHNTEFEEFWSLYPKRAGGNPKKAAKSKFINRRKDGVPLDELLSGVRRYCRFCEETDKIKTEYVQQTTTWLNSEGWTEEWEIPERKLTEDEEDALMEEHFEKSRKIVREG